MRALLVSLGLVACASTAASTTLVGGRAPEAGITDAPVFDASVTDTSVVDSRVRDTSVNPRAPAPRPVSPLSTARVTSRRPVFRWRNLPGETGAAVEVCGDRLCDRVEQVISARAETAAATGDLAPGVHFWRVRGAEGGASRVWEFFVGRGSNRRAVSYGSVSDFNADGSIDLALGVPGARMGVGQAEVYLGNSGELPNSPTWTLDGGAVQGGRFGQVVRSLGDLDGDGYPEVFVGGMTSGTSYRSGPDGPRDALLTRFASPRVWGVGDVNGDGYGDVCAYQVERGQMFEFLGGLAEPTFMKLFMVSAEFAAGLGDLDGDGFGEVAFATSTALTIYRGAEGGLTLLSSVRLPDAPAGTQVRALVNVGDVNGDGTPDLAARFTSPPTATPYVDLVAVYALSIGPGQTPSSVLTLPEGARVPRYGAALAGAGDVNGDGYDDVLVGGDGAYVYSGGANGVVPMPIARIEWAGAGASVSGMDDVDHDGLADLVVSGRDEVRFHLGNATGVRVPARLSIVTSRRGEGFGESVRGWE
jgi:hypothetical protein